MAKNCRFAQKIRNFFQHKYRSVQGHYAKAHQNAKAVPTQKEENARKRKKKEAACPARGRRLPFSFVFLRFLPFASAQLWHFGALLHNAPARYGTCVEKSSVFFVQNDSFWPFPMLKFRFFVSPLWKICNSAIIVP